MSCGCICESSSLSKMSHIKLFVLFIIIPVAKSAMPGTFFWKPRLALDLSIPTTESSSAIRIPTKDNIHEGTVVLIDGYTAGITVISMAAGLSSSNAYPHLNPTSAYFYTNAYRWGLRYLSLLPHWIGGHGGNYVATHKVWRRRFYYMDEFIPEWMKNFLPVTREEWDQEFLDWQRFKKYAEPAFGKHYRVPTKLFNDFRSLETHETAEFHEEVESESAI